MPEYRVRVWLELEQEYAVPAKNEEEACTLAERVALEQFTDAEVSASKVIGTEGQTG